MWWERVAELAYKMAVDCGQTQDFFDMMDELSRRSQSQAKKSSSALSTLLGHDWRSHRKRGRDPIPRISRFSGIIGDDEDKGSRKSVLVKRTKQLDDSPRFLDESPTPDPPQSPFDSHRPNRSMISAENILRRIAPDDTDPSPIGLSKSYLLLDDSLPSPPPPAKSSDSRNVNRERASSLGKAGPEEATRSVKRHSLPITAISVNRSTKTPVKPAGKPGLAEKKQKHPKKPRVSRTKEYIVNRLKGVKQTDDGQLVYLVEWEGDWDDTWEPYHFVAHLEEDIEQVYRKASPAVQASMKLAGHIEQGD